LSSRGPQTWRKATEMVNEDATAGAHPNPNLWITRNGESHEMPPPRYISGESAVRHLFMRWSVAVISFAHSNLSEATLESSLKWPTSHILALPAGAVRVFRVIHGRRREACYRNSCVRFVGSMHPSSSSSSPCSETANAQIAL
jgi:hypothetical protein